MRQSVAEALMIFTDEPATLPCQKLSGRKTFFQKHLRSGAATGTGIGKTAPNSEA